VVEVVAQFPDDEPSGLGFLPDGTLLVALMHSRRVVRVSSGTVQLHADLSDTADGFINDMIVDADGVAFVDCIQRRSFHDRPSGDKSDMGDQIARVMPDGSVAVACKEIVFPNGLALNPDGSSLIVAEARANRLTKFSIDGQKRLGQRTFFADTGPANPDGICLDVTGGVWAALPRAGEVRRFIQGGQVTAIVAVDAPQMPLACVLGGPARTDLYVATTTFDEAVSLQDRIHRGYILRTKVTSAGAGRP
jgi:sugar lactone lactonase YvrE